MAGGWAVTNRRRDRVAKVGPSSVSLQYPGQVPSGVASAEATFGFVRTSSPRDTVARVRRVIVTDGRVAVEAELAERTVERVRGLIGSSPGRALVLPRTRSVHTFGMRRAIDVVLLDAEARVLDVVRLPPRRLLLPRRGVRRVLEMDRAPFAAGGRLRIERG
jgi:uncharacterized membrane protein (UPF0127 family)